MVEDSPAASRGSRRELDVRCDGVRKGTLAEAGISSSDGEGEEDDQKEGVHPAIVMLGEDIGNRCMRIVDQKALGTRGEMKWPVQDMHEELKA